MARVFDVARFITEQTGEISAMKLQKLMYYAQAWHIVWEEQPLFVDDFEAWANGPVLPVLYARHRGSFKVSEMLFSDADTSRLEEEERESVEKVLAFYGDKTAQWLSNLTHQEDPWLIAREGIPAGTASSRTIPKAAMHEYYSAL